MLDTTTPEIRLAIQAVRQASLLVSQVQRELVSSALTKEDRSPVTVADYASQALIGYMLSQAFPKDALIAEETSAELRKPENRQMLEQIASYVKRFAPQATPDSILTWIDHGRADSAPRYWTLDPIDGTKGFLRGDQYAVALALVVAGEVRVGVLGCPNLVEAYRPDPFGPGSLVVAARGQGAWVTTISAAINYTELQVSKRSDPSQARILRSFESGHTNVSQIDTFAEAMGVQAEPVRMDSQAKYAILAAGKGDLYLRLLSASKPDYKEKIWDQAAGSLVLEEAGGKITDLDGKPLDFSLGRTLKENRGILASNSLLHPPALETLKSIGA